MSTVDYWLTATLLTFLTSIIIRMHEAASEKPKPLTYDDLLRENQELKRRLNFYEREPLIGPNRETA